MNVERDSDYYYKEPKPTETGEMASPLCIYCFYYIINCSLKLRPFRFWRKMIRSCFTFIFNFIISFKL